MSGAGRPPRARRSSPAGTASMSSGRTPKSAAWELGRLLVGLGHRHMAGLSGPEAVLTAVDRVKGFRRRSSTRAGCRSQSCSTARSPSTAATGWRSARWPSLPRRTALFAANNFIAIGTLHALAELGSAFRRTSPSSASTICPEAMVTFPFLTVAAQPAFEIGVESVPTLLDRLANPRAATEGGHPSHHAGDPAVQGGPGRRGRRSPIGVSRSLSPGLPRADRSPRSPSRCRAPARRARARTRRAWRGGRW